MTRAFTSLGWTATEAGQGWSLSKNGWRSVQVAVDANGVVRVTGERSVRFVPLCADLASADGDGVLELVKAADHPRDDVVLVHVGRAASLSDVDRASD